MKHNLNATLLALLLINNLAQAVAPFELPWMNPDKSESTYKSSSHRGAVYVIETYFLNCPYCNDNAKNVDTLASHYSFSDRVQVLDVGVDRSDAQYATWIDRHNPNHPVLKDARRQVVGELGTTSYPSTYVVDCKGKVLASSTGVWNEETRAKFGKVIEEQLWYPCED